MEVEYKINDGKLEAFLKGELDTISSPKFEKEICAKLDEVNEVVVDLTDVSYISSAGIRVFLYLQKLLMKTGKLQLRNPNEMVKEVFDVTGLNEVIDIV